MMKIFTTALLTLILQAPLFADDFVSVFMDRCAEDGRRLNNVNIGKTMLDRMAVNTDDEELKTTFRNLNSIRIVSVDNADDSEYYFRKAEELIEESFGDYREAVSLNETGAKISVRMKRLDEENQEIILLSLDEDGKLSIITVSGKIDFNSISKLSGSLSNGQPFP
jgi:hypothetical protein